MAILGSILVIAIAVFLLWVALAPKFNQIGQRVYDYIEFSKNSGIKKDEKGNGK